MKTIFERRKVMKFTDMIVSAIIKNGTLYEARNVDVEFDVPRLMTESEEFKSEKIKIHFKAEHMTLRIEKGSKEEA